MNIAELLEQFEIQGRYIIKVWKDDLEAYIMLAEGNNFEYEKWELKWKILKRKITYMYANDGVLVIEVEDK
jgi:hypothetical protein